MVPHRKRSFGESSHGVKFGSNFVFNLHNSHNAEPSFILQSTFATSHPGWGHTRRRRLHTCDVHHAFRFRHAGVRWRMMPTSSRETLESDDAITQSLVNRNIVITGGTGLIGRAVVDALREANSNVCLLSRNPPKARSLFAGQRGPLVSVLRYDAATSEPLSGGVYDAVTNADVVINLAGEPVDEGRWTQERKEVLFNSRVTGTRKIAEALRKQRSNTVLINASAVGYYGASKEKTFTEENGPGSDFLAKTAEAWEAAALSNSENSRTVVFRIGVVLANGGGALEKISAAFKAFLGGPLGGGTQWFSWVHIDDVVRLIIHASADRKWEGVYNASAPQPVRLAKFCEELGRALGRPSWLPVPRQAIQALLGNEAAELILAGQNVLPKRTRAIGFVYKYKDVASALQQLTKSKKAISRRGTLTNASK